VKVAAILRNHGVNIELSQDGHMTNNVVCSARTWPLNLAKMQTFAPMAVNYDPVKFPSAAVLHVNKLGFKDTKIVIECFQSGMLNLTGSKSYEESMEVFCFCIEQIFRHVRVANSTVTDVTVMETQKEKTRKPEPKKIDEEAAEEEMKMIMAGMDSS